MAKYLRTRSNSYKQTCYVRRNTWLAQFRQLATSEYWDQQWLARSADELRHALRPNGRMASHGRFFRQWLPGEGTVLEAGCGTGLWVRRFLNHGYRCIGLDYAVSTLLRSKRIVSELPLVGGDIFNLPFDDCSLAAYVSFGVVEHFKAGPGQALREAFRVLKPGGVALISVPYENPYRERVNIVSERVAYQRGLEFYQHYFKPATFLHELESAGLEPVYHKAHHLYGTHIGLREQYAIARFLLEKLPFQSAWTPILDLLPVLPRAAAHMMFTVSRKV